MREPFLRTDQRLHLGVRVELDAEPPFVELRDRLAERREPVVGRIPVGGRVLRGLLQGLDDVRRRRQVGIPDAERDHVGALGPLRRDALVQFGEQVRRQVLDALRQPHVGAPTAAAARTDANHASDSSPSNTHVAGPVIRTWSSGRQSIDSRPPGRWTSAVRPVSPARAGRRDRRARAGPARHRLADATLPDPHVDERVVDRIDELDVRSVRELRTSLDLWPDAPPRRTLPRSSSGPRNSTRCGFPIETAVAVHVRPSASNGRPTNVPPATPDIGTSSTSRIGAPMSTVTRSTRPASTSRTRCFIPARVITSSSIGGRQPAVVGELRQAADAVPAHLGRAPVGVVVSP